MSVCFKKNIPSCVQSWAEMEGIYRDWKSLDFLLSVRLLVQYEGGDTAFDLGDFLVLKGPMLSNFTQFNDRDKLAFGNLLNWGKNLSL